MPGQVLSEPGGGGRRSSRTSTAGWEASAAASASRWRSRLERVAGARSRWSRNPTTSRAATRRSSISAGDTPSCSGPNATSSSAVDATMLASGSWKTIPTPAAMRSRVSQPPTVTLPPKLPPVRRGTSPLSARQRVDLPAPPAPISPRQVPGSTRREMLRSAATASAPRWEDGYRNARRATTTSPGSVRRPGGGVSLTVSSVGCRWRWRGNVARPQPLHAPNRYWTGWGACRGRVTSLHGDADAGGAARIVTDWCHIGGRWANPVRRGTTWSRSLCDGRNVAVACPPGAALGSGEGQARLASAKRRSR